jgi:site-specific DNA recombinase
VGRRPQAAALVAQLADPDRGWDAIVIGEYERAFYGSQYAAMAPLFEHYGVQLWMPEAGGRVDYASEHDEKTMTGWGCRRSGRSPGPASGSGPRWPSRPGSRAGTWAAVRRTGTGSLMRGRTRTRRTPRGGGARTAWSPTRDRAVVRWIFAQRLAGHSVARIARALNEAGVPCPSAADPGRNTHRTGTGWTLGTVTTILENPRYTGRQVWNRQRTDTELADPANVTLGHKSVQRWNLPDGWVISRRPAHPALVSEDDFVAAQDINAARGPVPQDEPVLRRYLLAGLLPAGCAGGGWNQPGPTARPRTGAGTAAPARWRPDPSRPKNTYIREDKLCRTCPPCTCCSPPPPCGPGAAPEPEPT